MKNKLLKNRMNGENTKLKKKREKERRRNGE